MYAVNFAENVTITNRADAAEFTTRGALAIAFYAAPQGTYGSYLCHAAYGLNEHRAATFSDAAAVHYVVVNGADESQDARAERGQSLKKHADANPWSGYLVFRNNLSLWAETFPRPVADKPEMLAFYASVEHRKIGRLTETRPGRYLRKVFGALLNDTQIEELAHVWTREFAPRELYVTQDANLIEEVYENGPRSCMAYAAGGFDSDEHPARVYAGPDLAVAYIGESDDADGRAVVWPEKKIYARAYGDVARMRAALERAGFREGEHREFIGARLQYIPQDGDNFVLPYLDMADTVDLSGDYVVVAGSNGEYGAQETNGLNEGGGHRCADCGDRMSRDDSYYVEDHGDVCECCYSNSYFYCEETDRTWPMENRANTRCNTFISERGVERSDNWFYCDGNDEWVRDRDDDYVVLDDGRTVSMSWADGNAFRCDAQDEWVEIEHRNLRDDKGYVVARVKNWIELDCGEAVDRFHLRSTFEIAAWIAEEHPGARADYSTCDREAINALLDLWEEQDAADEDEDMAEAA